MKTNRLEAFSDGVLAIIITIMVLEMKLPHADTFSGLHELWPVIVGYVLSFIYLAIYWNNHHHLLHIAGGVNAPVLWANMHLLFWLSLIPFATGWMGENPFSRDPVMLYGIILLMAAIAYFILQGAIIRQQGKGGILDRAIGRDWKGKVSLFLYLSSIVLCFLSPQGACILYALVAVFWIIPDRRIERAVRMCGQDK